MKGFILLPRGFWFLSGFFSVSCTVLFLLLSRILYKAADTCGASFLFCCFEVLVVELLL